MQVVTKAAFKRVCCVHIFTMAIIFYFFLAKSLILVYNMYNKGIVSLKKPAFRLPAKNQKEWTLMNNTVTKTEYQSALKKLFDRYYSHLNERQREVVYTTEGPLLVLAGAGTGKTRVLTHRISHLLTFGKAPYASAEKDANSIIGAVNRELSDDELYELLRSVTSPACRPYEVLAITFTNKAAGEIRNRLVKLLGEEATAGIWSGTFHSICVRILRAHCEEIGYRRGFSIYDADDSKKLITTCMQQLSIDDKQLAVKTVVNTISRAKDKLITPEEFDAGTGNDYKQQQISSVYALYHKKLLEANAFDFDDLIMQTVMLFRKHTEILAKYASRFKYVLVDEYQDTSHAQAELTLLLQSGHGNLMVVGDDDQSIYKFRGATIENILGFEKKLPGAKMIRLEENYRSSGTILKAANSVIRHNFGRRGKELWTEKGDGEKIFVKRVDGQNEEARFILNTIIELMMREKRQYSDFAVLYRINAQSNALENVFAKSGIPYRIVGGLRFYERKEIKDIIAYLSVVCNPHDNLKIKRIINEPKRKIGESTVNAVEILADTYGTSMFTIMENAQSYPSISKSAYKFAPFTSLIHELSKIAETHKVSEVVDAALELSGYRAMLELEELNGDATGRLENANELISTAVEFENQNPDAALIDFLEEVALVSDIDNYDDSANAVVFMTIHNAKGLEFPVVFIPGMEEDIFPSQQSVMFPEDLEEERRLAYVAMTRAMDRLIMTNARERLLYGRTQYNQRSRFIDEISPELLNIDEPKRRPRFTDGNSITVRNKQRVLTNELTRPSVIAGDIGRTRSFDTFSVGDRVKHLTFGDGTVLSVTAVGADVLYEIAFDTAGTKKLMATYAKLKKA